MDLPADNGSWNEFQWEKEFRREELRIAGYYRALASCLDLPGEDDIIRRRMAQAEHVPAAQFLRSEWNRQNSDGEEESEEQRFASETDWRCKPGAEACRRIEALAAAWNRLASSFEQHHTEAVLVTSCRFGALLEKVYALSDNYISPVAMRISIVKRILGDINGLLGDLENWSSSCRKSGKELADIIKHLHYFREAAVDSLTAIRMEDEI